MIEAAGIEEEFTEEWQEGHQLKKKREVVSTATIKEALRFEEELHCLLSEALHSFTRAKDEYSYHYQEEAAKEEDLGFNKVSQVLALNQKGMAYTLMVVFTFGLEQAILGVASCSEGLQAEDFALSEAFSLTFEEEAAVKEGLAQLPG